MPATLYVIATPIGNLEDVTLRALRILREEVSKIACEDTRQTQKLLNHFEIVKPLVSYHEHNEAARTEDLLTVLERGESVALVSDAGTPLISDPGYRLVRAAIERGFAVVPLPGASAVLAALAGAGLPTESFRFVGFLPPKRGARRKALEGLVGEQSTAVLYESPHRILESLADVAAVLGSRPVVVCREVTKLHEEFLRGTAESIGAELGKRPSIKGEFTVVIGRGEEVAVEGDPKEEVARLEAEMGMERMEAIKTVAKRRGLAKGEVYRVVMQGSGGRK